MMKLTKYAVLCHSSQGGQYSGKGYGIPASESCCIQLGAVLITCSRSLVASSISEYGVGDTVCRLEKNLMLSVVIPTLRAGLRKGAELTWQ
jgi:hypothetical protein